MNVWLVNPFAHLPADGFPVDRFRQLAREFARLGHRVTWWSSTFNHFLKAVRQAGHQPTPEDPFDVRMLPTMAYRRNTSAARLASHARLAVTALRAFSRESDVGSRESGSDSGPGRLPAVIVCGWAPVELAAATAWFAGRHNIPLCLDVPDPWPDSFQRVMPRALRPLAPLLLWPYRRLACWAMRRANGVTAISQTFLDWALALRGGARPAQSAVFFPVARRQAGLPVRSEPGRPLAVVFAGTLGAMYDFDLMLAAAELADAQRPGATRFLFAGSGPRREELLARRHPGNVEFTGPLREVELDGLMRRCDLGLCCFPPWASTTLTTKLFHYLSYGLPVLGTPQGEMVEFLARHEVGATVSTPGELAAAIGALIDEPGRWRGLSRAARSFSEAHCLEEETARMADLVLGLADARTG